MREERTQTGDGHITFSKFEPGVLEKSYFDIKAFILFKCSTNRSITTKLNKHLLGRVTHCFQLASRKTIEEHTDVLSRVRNLMIRLRTHSHRAQL